jgi:hypothetical protein
MNFAFYVNEELVRDGHTEDGGPREKSVYNVVYEREDGKRLRHFKTFDEATAAQALCEKIIVAWSDDIPLSPKYWDSFPARYGSEYYCRSGEEQRWRQEERDLERNDGYYD